MTLLLQEETKPYLMQSQCGYGEAQERESADGAACVLFGRKGRICQDYQDASVQCVPSGESCYEELKKQLRQAERHIFMEYFIVDQGGMWDSILEILRQKAQEGVEVRFMYDGMCSLLRLPYKYPRQLQAMGIQCKMFAPVRPLMSTSQNNRDHRKVVVVDGITAFTGGINLADEYINQKLRFGHWKDTGGHDSGRRCA